VHIVKSSKAPIESDLEEQMPRNRAAALWRAMAGFRLLYLGAMVGEAVAAALGTAIFVLLRYFVDDVLGTRALPRLLPRVALGLVGLALLRGVFLFLSSWLSTRVAEGIALRLRNYLFDHVQRLSLSTHDRTESGDLIQRLTSDVDALRRFFADEVMGLGRTLLIMGFSFAALLKLHSQLALLSSLLVPLIAVISLIFSRRISRVYGSVQYREAGLARVLQENLAGIREVRAFAGELRERAKFTRENSERYRAAGCTDVHGPGIVRSGARGRRCESREPRRTRQRARWRCKGRDCL
jgi:ATP-binding cassette subfamily B protein